MENKRYIVIGFLVIFIGVMSYQLFFKSEVSPTPAASVEAMPKLNQKEALTLKQRYEQARNKVRDNCFTCMDSTKEAIKEGISDLEDVIADGVQTFDAYLWLARSYRELAVGFEDSNKDVLLAKESDILRKLVKIQPNNYEVFSGYVNNLSADEMIVEYKKFILRNPNNADAHYMLYKLYISGTNPNSKNPVHELKKAFRLAKYEKAWNYGRELHDRLIQMGLSDEAEEVAKAVEEVRKSL